MCIREVRQGPDGLAVLSKVECEAHECGAGAFVHVRVNCNKHVRKKTI